MITLHDVIEDTFDPMLLRKATELLRPNGLINIWTPNAWHALEEDEPVAFNLDLEHM